jgi:hypothetical protein
LKLQEIIEEVNSVGGDIFCLIEIKKKIILLLGQFMLAWSGVGKLEKAKAVFIHRNLVKDIQDIQYVNERCLRLDLRIYGRDIILLAIYAPTDDSTTQMKEYSMRCWVNN